jgi:uncharacterized membrane protein YoaK (UPF0700 family)
MFQQNHEEIYRPKFLYLWFMLAFQGGFLNTAGFLGVGRFVSHVSGFATLFGVFGASGAWIKAIGMLSTPVFYLFGSMFSAWFIERRKLLKEAPYYPFVFFYIVLWLILVLFIGNNGGFGDFGNHLDSMNNFFYLFTIAFICGLQNSMVSSATSNIIRTTHLTGPLTDLGIGIVRVWTNGKKGLHEREFFSNLCRLGIIFSFTLGSLIGAFILMHFQYNAFILPVLISSFSAIFLLKFSPH